LKVYRPLLVPFSWIYGAFIKLHQSLYSCNILKSSRYQQALINVGNLSLGGTGKSPMVAFIYQHICQLSPTAVISRGYGRKTKGLIQVYKDSTVDEVGDEAIQFKKRFPNSIFYVSENRSTAIEHALKQSCTTFILDDALQHHALQTTFNLLLTTYEQPFFDDYLLPLGRLRDCKKNYKKASHIIVTKCPASLNTQQKEIFEDKLKVCPGQKVFFTRLQYGKLYPLFGQTKATSIDNFRHQKTVLVCGIAQPSSLYSYLNNALDDCSFLAFSDHHDYGEKDLQTIVKESYKKTIITTEKDAVKLQKYANQFKENGLMVWVLPIKVAFLFQQESAFVETLQDYIQSCT
jgi:tetraacyldisaccharide 4'-kinase